MDDEEDWRVMDLRFGEIDVEPFDRLRIVLLCARRWGPETHLIKLDNAAALVVDFSNPDVEARFAAINTSPSWTHQPNPSWNGLPLRYIVCRSDEAPTWADWWPGSRESFLSIDGAVSAAQQTARAGGPAIVVMDTGTGEVCWASAPGVNLGPMYLNARGDTVEGQQIVQDLRKAQRAI